MKKALFAISSLGLGHATRSLAVIKHFEKEYDITIISYGNALKFLQEELSQSNISFIEIEDYPKLERGDGIYFYFYLFTDLIKTNFVIKKEHKVTIGMEDDYEFIFSDGRYGVYSSKVPSFLLSHQISFIPPKWLAFFKFVTDFSNYFYFKNFNKVFIPDYKKYNKSLAGNLAHTSLTNFFPHDYIGIVSLYKELNIQEDIDYLFIISGYLEDKKKSFISKLLEQAKKLDGKKVFILGNTSENEIIQMEEENITIYPSATKNFRNELFCRAKTIVSRTGYTTIMDLVELDKKAILFPTPNSTEQEYLATYHQYKNYFVICEDEDSFDLKELSATINKTVPLKPESKTNEALLHIEKTIKSYFHQNYFSIIVPVFNEEKYLSDTIEKLLELNYNKDYFEIIIVENGSTDESYKIAKAYEEKTENLNVYQSLKGVSKAKNLGLKYTNKESDFSILLDADTLLEKDFLNELNNYLNKNTQNNLSIGTTAIKPADNNSWYDRCWYNFFDIAHKITKTSYSIQIAKTSIAKEVKFDEELNYSEDLKFVKTMLIFGNFFFLNTKQVATSTRRFRQDGYFKTLFYWNIQALTPEKLKKHKPYSTVR
ncbi:MAG: glycosyltransferase [Epsilonproteobacteria bacterium]|nr:glycosyltransferase [Campylobacterota bacterium]